MSMRRLIIIAALLALPVPASAASFVYVGVKSSFPSSFTGPGPAPTGLRVLDSQTLDTVATIAMPAGQTVRDIVLGLGDRRAYVATADDAAATGSLVVVDTTTNTVLTVLPLPGYASSVALSTDHQRVFVGHAPSTVSVFSTADHSLVAQISIGASPFDLAASPDGTTMFVGHANGVAAIATSTLTIARTITTPSPYRLAISADGREVYVSHFGDHSISVITTATGAVESIAFPQLYPYALLVIPYAGTVWVSSGRPAPGGDGGGGTVSIFDPATRSFVGTVNAPGTLDGALDPSAHLAYFITANGRFSSGSVRVFDTDTKQVVRFRATNDTSVTGGAIALGNPGGCAFQVTPSAAQFGPAGGTGTISIPAPAGCTWTVGPAPSWITFTSPTGGNGPGTISYSVAPDTGDPRAASLSIAGQTVVINQTIPYTWIDEPVAGSTLNQPFDIRGWAIVRDANPKICCDSFVDQVQIQAIPANGGAAITLGNAARVDRADIMAAFGSGYANAGFVFTVRGLAAGTYTLVANARSARTGQIDSRSVTLTVTSSSVPTGIVEAPRDGDEVTQPFLVAGWAADAARASGTGVDAVNVYAYPEAGGTPIFLGTARYGAIPRPDVARYFNNDPAMSGTNFLLLAQGLQIGRYQIVAFAHSTVTGEFFARSVTVSVIGSSEAIMQIDIATAQSVAGSCCRVQMMGWAVDRRSTSGSGISTVHAWAYPEAGGSPVFLFATNPGIERDVTTILFGQQFARAGFTADSGVIPKGAYRVVAYALSTVTGTFDAVRVVRVVIP